MLIKKYNTHKKNSRSRRESSLQMIVKVRARWNSRPRFSFERGCKNKTVPNKIYNQCAGSGISIGVATMFSWINVRSTNKKKTTATQFNDDLIRLRQISLERKRDPRQYYSLDLVFFGIPFWNAFTDIKIIRKKWMKSIPGDERNEFDHSRLNRHQIQWKGFLFFCRLHSSLNFSLRTFYSEKV